jgi:pyruvate/2-oxoglutarate dehydrogenase complex dihydrolipoamide dehydrogenase (E3) component
VRGHARFVGRRDARFVLDVGGDRLTASQVVLDTGTRSRMPPVPGLREADPLHAGNWLDRAGLPERLLVIGAGVVALEMGQLYARLGSRVTVVGRSERVAGREDADVADALRGALEADGVTFVMHAEVERIERSGAGWTALVATGSETGPIECSHIFVATGREPNTADLGLETIGLTPEPDGTVRVDERLASAVVGVWVAGDIRGGPQFTHTAWDDHRILLSQMTGDGARTTRRVVPYGIYTDPELGRVGLGEEEARRSGRPFDVHRFDIARNGRARERGEAGGFIKVLAEPGTRRILGAAVFSTLGAELVHLYVDLMNAGATSDVLRDAVHAHPTLAEAVQSAVTS